MPHNEDFIDCILLEARQLQFGSCVHYSFILLLLSFSIVFGVVEGLDGIVVQRIVFFIEIVRCYVEGKCCNGF